jgi:hypothetical protein
MLSRTALAVRSPVLVARKKSFRCRAIHGAMRSSESPYRGAPRRLAPAQQSGRATGGLFANEQAAESVATKTEFAIDVGGM